MIITLTGCAISLPFNNRLSYPAVRDAKALNTKYGGSIALKWIPQSFTNRVDIQGASGFYGSLSKTRIPTGIGLSNRILEALDSFIGVDDSSANTLVLNIIEAKTEFEYSAGFTNITHSIDVGRCILEIEFSFDGKRWRKKFFSEIKDPTVGGTSQTSVVERVWDDIAIQVAKSVQRHI